MMPKTFINHLSRYVYIYLMKHKSKIFDKFKELQIEVKNHCNKKIKFLQFYRGSEYLSYEFDMHLKAREIVSQLTLPRTPHQMLYPSIVISL
jgi:hypothetical protein